MIAGKIMGYKIQPNKLAICLTIGCFLISNWIHGQLANTTTSIEYEYDHAHWELTLNGDWFFADSTEKTNNQWNTLPVPGNWNTYTEYADYIGDGWYQRKFTVPSEWKGKKIYIQFDAVYDIADVWLDQTYLGQHVGGYTPFEFDVTEIAIYGESQTVTVKANNEHVVGAWFQWGGISRNVRLIARDNLRLIRQKIEPVYDIETGTAQVKLLVTIANEDDQDHWVSVTGNIHELSSVAFRMSGKIAAGNVVTLTNNIMLNSTQTRCWHFDDPQLYNLKTSLCYQGKVLDQLQDRFGIRKVDIKSDGLYLNGEKVRLMGYNRVHDHRAYGNTEPRHLVRSDVDMMKRSGANFSRIMHAPCSPELLDYCDEKGLLIWAEIPMWQKVYRTPMTTEEDAKNAPHLFPGQTITEMIQRDWNHPCIVGWSPGNELRWEASKYVQYMRPLVKKLDPTRFYANIHDQGFQEQSRGGYKGLDVHHVDVLFLNKYGQDETKIKAVLDQHKSIPDLPLFVSEYGEARSESLNHSVNFTSLWKRLGKEPYVIGGAHWTFNDYRSYWWKATPSSQNRDWGVVDVWRNPKTFYYQMSKVNAPVRFIKATIENKRANITIQPRGTLEIPSFTLRGYSWVYELVNENDILLEGGLNDLEDISPGDTAILKQINWKTNQANQLIVSLISTNGYTVSETRLDIKNGVELPLPSYPEPDNPDVRKVLPLDRGFMIGVTSQTNDKGIEVRYGKIKNKYDESLSAPVWGAIRIRGLENGQIYFGQVRRLEATGPGKWSDEFIVTPDGGLLPDPPKILGLIKGKKEMAIRVEAQDKIEGFVVHLDSGKKITLKYSNPGLLILPGNSIGLNAINAAGQSTLVRFDDSLYFNNN